MAANFAGTLEKLQKDFEATGIHKLTIISGATGKLTAQISAGAPFDMLLSADDKATKKLAEGGQAVPDSEFTYAIGMLALFSSDPQLIKGDGEAVLKRGNFTKLAIANPKVAPYGIAAESTMAKLGVTDAVKDKIVMGENIAQTFQMIDTGNAQLGFVALSQVLGSESGSKGSHWVVPGILHDPIRQNAVLLTRAKDNAEAKAFLEFLQSPEAREKIKAAGYETADD
ncbi:MAG: molybdate ABC transporter substrate-binding protein [Aestuariivirgaceae bacterium]